MKIIILLLIVLNLSGCAALYEGDINNNSEWCTLTHPKKVGGC